jgi:malate dehydrogenase (oxaloacetate-decarboxylating)(NADP+)
VPERRTDPFIGSSVGLTIAVFLRPKLISKEGKQLQEDPILNKGTGFSQSERDALKLRGLVPPRTLSLATQAEKVMKGFHEQATNIEKNQYLSNLQNRNEALYFKTLISHIKELAPIVYTPTVGETCQKFGGNFRTSRGMYFCAMDKGKMGQMTFNWPENDVQVIVVTDGSRILGLGDLGTNGMGIPIGKLALYVAAGGIDPSKVLPVMFDVGTDNPELQNDEFYLGMQHPRLRGPAYYALLDEFMQVGQPVGTHAGHLSPRRVISGHRAPLAARADPVRRLQLRPRGGDP